MLENVPNIWIFQKNSLYLPASKGSLWLSGQNPARGKPLSTLPNFSMSKVLFDYPGKFPAREQDLIDTTPRKRVSIL